MTARQPNGHIHGSAPGWGLLTIAEIAAARTLWETTDMTARDIAKHFTTDRPHRHQERDRQPRAPPGGASARADDREKPPRTLYDRLAELHEHFNERTGKPPGTGYVRGPGAPLR